MNELLATDRRFRAEAEGMVNCGIAPTRPTLENESVETFSNAPKIHPGREVLVKAASGVNTSAEESPIWPAVMRHTSPIGAVTAVGAMRRSRFTLPTRPDARDFTAVITMSLRDARIFMAGQRPTINKKINIKKRIGYC